MALTSERLNELVSYNTSTGLFAANVRRGRNKAGDVVGYVTTNGYIKTRINGVKYLALRLAWL